MQLTGFDEFVQQEQIKAATINHEDFNPLKEKEEWLQNLDNLYGMVTAYLDNYVRAGQVSIDYRQISLNEEYIGDYSARQMLITIGTKVIRLEPVGTFLIGSKGRVDVVGPVARAHLMLIDSKIKVVSDMVHTSLSLDGAMPSLAPVSNQPIKWTWRLVTRPPLPKFVGLSQEVFLALLVEIANG